MTLRGFEVLPTGATTDNKLGKPGQSGDAESGADPAKSEATTIVDPDLTHLFVSWPTLPEPIRAAILALVNCHDHT
jgi:hypothetical protein